MLQHLSIRNFAIIDRLEIEFKPGLNILSGETGAGKSILVLALNLIIGARGSVELIRSGEEECEVIATFDLTKFSQISSFLIERGYESEDLLFIRRTFNRSGKSKVFINDRPATVGTLQELGKTLLEIVGQHASQDLLIDETPRLALDSFGKDDSILEEYRSSYDQYHQLFSELQNLEFRIQSDREKEEFYRFQLKEIEDGNLKMGEEEEFLQEKKVLSHFSKIYEAVNFAEAALYSSDQSVIELIGKIEGNFQKILGIDPSLDEKATNLKSISFEIEEIARFFQTYLQKNRFDPERLGQVEDRLEEISKLKKKYGGSIPLVLEKQEELKKQVNLIENFEESVKELNEKIDLAKKSLQKRGGELTQIRKKNAKKLEDEIQKELASLSMEQARFEIRVLPMQQFSPTGKDQVEFFVSSNKGEELKPLAMVASGGELSRIYLALKSILTRPETISTYLFDEVDTGIGGGVAESVGKKLKKIALHSQVICITHLPQIAACADAHFQIQKIEKKERMITQVKFLEIEERIQEIARMLAGSQITEKALSHASELIGNQSGQLSAVTRPLKTKGSPQSSFAKLKADS